MARKGKVRVRAISMIAFAGLLLAACASPPGSDGDLVPGVGSYRVGEPYQIKGVWYSPAVDYNYDRTGTASWYGEEFEGRLTANGEIFDLNALTAAHTTLPLPSIVQVTNLENGRSLQLRVNDRGPFVDGRLIDVSRRAAQLLGFESQGTTLVRVTILRDESIAAAEEAMRSAPVMVATISGSGPAPLPRLGPSYAAAPEPRRAARIARAIEPETRSASSFGEPGRPRSMLTAMVPLPVAPPAAPASQTAIAMLPPPPARSTHAARYRFSLISPAEAAELSGFRTSARKSEDTRALATVAKMPPSSPKIDAAPKHPSGWMFVQAGAFSQRDNAERAERRIARWGSPQVITASVRGAAMYRVRIGPFDSETQAQRALARVVNDGFPGAHIVGD
jgi:rare lipoprotein A